MTLIMTIHVFILKHILEIPIILETITCIFFHQGRNIKGELENFIRDHVHMFKN